MKYIIGAKSYPVIGSVKMKNGTKVPVVDMKLITDYEWQLGCLRDRLEHREKYAAIGEDVDAEIERLLSWLEEHEVQEEN